MLRDNADIFDPMLTDILDDCIKKGMFADELKLADISPIFKSMDCTAKNYYRPISKLNLLKKSSLR